MLEESLVRLVVVLRLAVALARRVHRALQDLLAPPARRGQVPPAPAHQARILALRALALRDRAQALLAPAH